jgi:hypothetical protein
MAWQRVLLHNEHCMVAVRRLSHPSSKMGGIIFDRLRSRPRRSPWGTAGSSSGSRPQATLRNEVALPFSGDLGCERAKPGVAPPGIIGGGRLNRCRIISETGHWWPRASPGGTVEACARAGVLDPGHKPCRPVWAVMAPPFTMYQQIIPMSIIRGCRGAGRRPRERRRPS